ncbi:hypothetical protein KHQ82_10085 [Mycoplasmatota bacterium]|nr:hypothetical protein KHQ82_10085 [Mycoplasmatota bacterium]
MENQYEEISLKELFEVIWRGKFVIVGVTLVFLVAGLLYTQFYVDEKYEATTTVTVNDVYFTPNSENYYPTYNALSPEDILSSTDFGIKVFEELGIEGKSLQGLISNVSKKNNVITIKIVSTSKEEANSVASELAIIFDEYVETNIKAKATEVHSLIENRIEEQSNDLEETQNIYLSNISSSDNYLLLQIERDNVLSRIKFYNNELITLEPSIDVKLHTLATLRKNFDLSSVLTSEIADILSSGNFTKEIKIEELTEETIKTSAAEIVVALTSEINKLEVFEGELESLTERLLELDSSITLKKLDYQTALSNLSLAENNYSSSQNDLSESFEVMNDEGMNIVLLNDVSFAENAVSPNKILNSAVSVVLGGFIGVMVVFIKKYWME